MLGDYFKLAFENLKQRKIRSWLTILGIVIGISAIVALISLSQGMSNAIEEQFKSFGARNLRIVPGSLQGPPIGIQGLTEKDVETAERLGFAEYVTPVLIRMAQVEHNDEKQFLITYGYDTKTAEISFKDINLNTAEGRIFGKQDLGVAVIGYSLSDRSVFEKNLRINEKIVINGKNFKVIGVLEKQGNDRDKMIYVPLEDGREIFDAPTEVNAILVKVSEGYDMDKAVETAKKDFKKDRKNENFEIITPKDIINRINSILGIINFVLVSIAAISLVVGGLGIMNSMFTSVLERTKEIGVMKAIGAKNSSITILFLIESGLIGMVGGVLGVGLGLGIAKMVEIGAAAAGFSLIKIVPDPLVVFGSLGFAFFLGVASGVLPAIRAANMKPVDSLRYE